MSLWVPKVQSPPLPEVQGGLREGKARLRENEVSNRIAHFRLGAHGLLFYLIIIVLNHLIDIVF